MTNSTREYIEWPFEATFRRWEKARNDFRFGASKQLERDMSAHTMSLGVDGGCTIIGAKCRFCQPSWRFSLRHFTGATVVIT